MCTFVYRTLCGMNVSCQKLVCTGSRGSSAPESRQAFARCSSTTRDGWGKTQFTLTGVYTDQGKLWVQVHIPKLKPILNFRTGKSKPGTEIQENNNGLWAQSPNLYTNAFALPSVFLLLCVLWVLVWQSAGEDTQISLSVTAKPTGCAYIYCIFLYYTQYSNK